MSERDQRLVARFQEGATYRELSKEFDISAERCRIIVWRMLGEQARRADSIKSPQSRGPLSWNVEAQHARDMVRKARELAESIKLEDVDRAIVFLRGEVRRDRSTRNKASLEILTALRSVRRSFDS